MTKRNWKLLGLAFCTAVFLSAAALPARAEDADTTISEEADWNDLSVVRSMELQYANNFAVDYCANGDKIITDGDGRKLLLIPEGGQAPEDPGDMQILQAPLTKLGCFSTTHAALFHAIGAVDKINLVTTAQDRWYIPEVAEGIENGTITYVGKNSDPDYELISAAAPEVILITANTMHGSDEVLAKLDELNITYIAESQHLENHPLGRVEWVKLVGALLDMEEEAEAYFEDACSRVDAVVENVSSEQEHPVILQTYLYDGTVYVRNSADYVVKMLELAGGTYTFADLEPGQSGNTKMTVEEFYKEAVNTDIMIYDNIDDPNISTVADLLEYGDYLADMKAIQDGNVWGLEKNYFQSYDDIATMIEDISTIIYHPENEDDLHYFYRMPTE